MVFPGLSMSILLVKVIYSDVCRSTTLWNLSETLESSLLHAILVEIVVTQPGFEALLQS